MPEANGQNPETNRPVEVHILAGGISPPPVAQTSGKRMWAMALTPETTVLDHWMARLHDLGVGEPPATKLLISEPLVPTERAFVRCRGVQPIVDTEDFRGPAGALRDACEGLNEEDVILVCELSRAALCPLNGVIETHTARANDVTVAANPDGSPAGVYAITVESPGVPSLRTARHFVEALRLINERSEVVVRERTPHRNKASEGGPRSSLENNRGPGEAPTVRTGLIPDGSIKTPSGVVDGSHTGSRALSDDSTHHRSRESRRDA